MVHPSLLKIRHMLVIGTALLAILSYGESQGQITVESSTIQTLVDTATPTATEPHERVILMATPVPVTTTVTNHADEIFTFVPTATIDPKDVHLFTPDYIAAKAALDAVVLEPLPVIQNKSRSEWVFRWKESWTSPNLENIPGLTLLPGGIPYLYNLRFVIRPYPFDPDNRGIETQVAPGVQEVHLSDMELASGTYFWSVRGQYVSLSFKEFTAWMPWQEIHIPSTDPKQPLPYIQHYTLAKTALDTVALEPLPVIRNKSRNEWIFQWKESWIPPRFDGVSGLTLYPDGMPYMYRLRFVIRPYPFDPDKDGIAEYVPPGKSEVHLSDMELVAGTYFWSVRGEYISLDFKEVTAWMPWQEIHIIKESR